MGRVAGRGTKSQAKPNPKMYQTWIEYEDGRPPLFMGNARTMRGAERKVSFREYMRYAKNGGGLFYHYPDREGE